MTTSLQQETLKVHSFISCLEFQQLLVPYIMPSPSFSILLILYAAKLK